MLEAVRARMLALFLNVFVRVPACAHALASMRVRLSASLFFLFKRKGLGCLFLCFSLPVSLCICHWLFLSLSLQS